MYPQKSLIFLLVACVALSSANSDLDSLPPSGDFGLLNFMSRSSNIIQRNPFNAMSCSDYYMPLINGIILQFEENSKACSEDAKQKRSAAEAASAENQDELENRADSVCGEVIQCKDGESAKSSLQCYVEVGAKASKSLRVLSNDASVQSAALNEEIRRINSDENKCITENKQQYEADTAAVYEEFSDCIYGLIPVPTTPTPETAAPSS